MIQSVPPPGVPPRRPLPRNVKVLGLASLLLGRAADQFGPRPLVFLGWLVYAGVYLAFGLAAAAWQAWACFLVYALFYGLTEPAEKALVADLVGGERKGLAYGWYNFAIGVATLPASLVFGALYQYLGALAAFGWGLRGRRWLQRGPRILRRVGEHLRRDQA